VDVRKIARRDVKVHHDRLNHFLGTNVKGSNKDSAPLVCTEFDRLVLLRNDGTCRVISVPEKEYIGPTKYVMLWNKDQVYCILYRDRQEGTWFVKRFTLEQFTLGREYHIVPPNCLIENLYTNSGVVLSLELAPNNRRSYHAVTVDFDRYALRSREAKGYKLTQYPVTTINVIKRGSTMAPPQNDEGSDDVPADGGDTATGEPTTSPSADGAADEKHIKPTAPPADTTPKPQSPRNSAAQHDMTDAEDQDHAVDGDDDQEGAAADQDAAADGGGREDAAGDRQKDAAEDDDQDGVADDGSQAAPDPDAVKKGAAKGMSRLRKLIDEDTPFFLED